MGSADEAVTLSEVASRLAERGDFRAAIENYQVALAQHSGDSAAMYEQLSQCYSEIDLYQEAHEAALMAHSTAPQVLFCVLSHLLQIFPLIANIHCDPLFAVVCSSVDLGQMQLESWSASRSRPELCTISGTFTFQSNRVHPGSC